KPKNPKPSAKEHPAKDDTCHHCKEVGHWKRKCLVYLVELLKKKKQVGFASSLGILRSTDDASFDQCISCLSGKMTRKSFPYHPERATDLLGIIHTDVCGPLRHVSRQESATHILNMVPTKKVDKTPYELWFGKVPNLSYLKVAEFFEKKLITQEVSGRAVDLEEIQNEDTSPFEIPSEIPMEVEGFEPPQEEVILIRRVDYEETFSPVADIRAIKILTSITAFYDYEIWQMDVKTTFLNGYLDEDIYMVQPERFVDPNHPRKRYKMDNSKRGHIPMQERLDLNKTQGASTPKEVKRMQMYLMSAVGPIMYVVRCTRPDVAFAQNITSLFQQNPGEGHWTVVKNILKYLRNTKEMFLVYGGNPKVELRVDCYCDAGFETDIDNIKSRT
nr:retrotransposon protein, putative, Ty1-copia subclass [Tanacetum cinerariifolium]